MNHPTKKFKLAILTSGGDAPGMSTLISIITTLCHDRGWEVAWIEEGYKGLVNNQFVRVDQNQNQMAFYHGGTFIGSSRFPCFREVAVVKTAVANLQQHGIDQLVTIGGDGTFAGAKWLAANGFTNVAMLPGSIDNDVPHTTWSLGFKSSVEIVYHQLIMIRNTAWSHRRCLIVETMGRDCGAIALRAGMAANADVISIPEAKLSQAAIIAMIQAKKQKNVRSVLVVVTENMYDLSVLVREVACATGFETRSDVVGYAQRGNFPGADDSYFALQLAACLIEHCRQLHEPFYVVYDQHTVQVKSLASTMTALPGVEQDKQQRCRANQQLCVWFNRIKNNIR